MIDRSSATLDVIYLYKIRNEELGTYLGVEKAHGRPFWPTVLVPTRDDPYTDWLYTDNNKIINWTLKTCLGVEKAHGRRYWPTVLVPSPNDPYTTWEFDARTVKCTDLGTFLGVEKAHGRPFWPTILVSAPSDLYTKWLLERADRP
jgi:hypothetical protein